jgi:hypothetical protein
MVDIPMIDNFAIDTIKAANDCRLIVAADLGEPDSRNARSWVWACPFHDERTVGGFHVFKDGFKCFSCGVHGDVLGWRMDYHKESFAEAVTALGGDAASAPDPAAVARRAAELAERAARELERQIEKAQQTLAELRQAQTWLEYYDQLDDAARRRWEGRGVPAMFQDWWQLGFNPDYTLWRRENGKWVDWWHSPTLSIPIWGEGWQVNNVKHRLLVEPPTGEKYRQERTGVPAAPFIANPDRSGGALLLVEGEIKSMVSYVTLTDRGNRSEDSIQVAGLPGVTPDPALFGQFENYDPVYLCMDPDAYVRKQAGRPSPAENAVMALGRERVRSIRLPDKIDDLIVHYQLDRAWLLNLMRTARRTWRDE